MTGLRDRSRSFAARAVRGHPILAMLDAGIPKSAHAEKRPENNERP
jgi:hypothetical protein